MGLKFIRTDLHESIDLLVDEKNRNENPKYYITGPFIMTEEANQNKRIYSLNEMVSEVARYTKEMIETKRSIGELNHPQSVEVNPANACHLVTELKQNGNYFIGKSLLLDTPMGNLVKSLVKDGVRLGISTRGLGSLEESGGGVKRVKDFHLICLDIVHQPSVQDAMLESVLESKEWIIQEDGSICEISALAQNKLKNQVSRLPKKDVNLFLQEQLINFIQKLKGLT